MSAAPTGGERVMPAPNVLTCCQLNSNTGAFGLSTVRCRCHATQVTSCAALDSLPTIACYVMPYVAALLTRTSTTRPTPRQASRCGSLTAEPRTTTAMLSHSVMQAQVPGRFRARAAAPYLRFASRRSEWIGSSAVSRTIVRSPLISRHSPTHHDRKRPAPRAQILST